MLMNVGSGGKYDEESVLGFYSDSFPLSLASWWRLNAGEWENWWQRENNVCTCLNEG